MKDFCRCKQSFNTLGGIGWAWQQTVSGYRKVNATSTTAATGAGALIPHSTRTVYYPPEAKFCQFCGDDLKGAKE